MTKKLPKIQQEIEKKGARRKKELEELKDLLALNVNLDNPVAPKKPIEFKFEKNDVKSFEYPIGIGNKLIEKKSDGYCVHVSINPKANEKIKIYSSNSNEWNPKCFPDVVKDLKKYPAGYYHGEILGSNPGIKRFTSLDEFIAIEKRPKTSTKDLSKELIEKYPLKLDIFDALMIKNKPLLSTPLKERRNMLEKIIQKSNHVNLIPQWEVKDKESLQKLFIQAINNNYEGLIAKDPHSFYVPGSRDSDWIKLKEFTTLDLIVLGFYETPESKKAGKPFSAVLVGSYNEKTRKFETTAKVKVGSKKDQEEIYQKAKGIINTKQDYDKTIKASPHIVFNPKMRKIKKKIPNKIIKYNLDDKLIVIETQILNITYSENWHSCGLNYDKNKAHSLRLPTFKQLRKDKTRLKEVTTTNQMHNYYIGK